MKINWKWPSAPGNDYLPWYRSLWCSICVIPFIMGLLLAYSGIRLARGKEEADEWLRNAL